MGCGPSENMAPNSHKIVIWGDYFSQDTRALLAICQMAGADIDFRQVDTLKRQNLDSPFIDQNPNGTIPMLTHGQTKVIGDGEAIFNYMVNSNQAVSSHFFHEGQSRKINEIMQYFTRTIRRVTVKLIQAVVLPRAFNQKRRTDEGKIQQYLTEFFDIILAKINGYLTESGYMTGPQISIVDIMIFCELETICTMYSRDVPPSLTKLRQWYDKLSSEASIKAVNS